MTWSEEKAARARELLAAVNPEPPAIRKHIAWMFIDWFPLHTALYLRGERGKGQAETEALYAVLHGQLREFFAPREQETRDLSALLSVALAEIERLREFEWMYKELNK